MGLKASQTKFSSYVIHTGNPGYKIFKNDLDPEVKRLKEVVDKKGIHALTDDPTCRDYKAKEHAIESLPYTKKRAENMFWAEADEHGDFIVDNPEDADDILACLDKDPEPRPYLDKRSPNLAEALKKLGKEQKSNPLVK